MLFLLHARLVDDGLAPGAAVRAVRRWMRDPGRVPPAHLPAIHAATLAAVDPADPPHWSALVHYGVR